jgi:hypothetical protein
MLFVDTSKACNRAGVTPAYFVGGFNHHSTDQSSAHFALPDIDVVGALQLDDGGFRGYDRAFENLPEPVVDVRVHRSKQSARRNCWSNRLPDGIQRV